MAGYFSLGKSYEDLLDILDAGKIPVVEITPADAIASNSYVPSGLFFPMMMVADDGQYTSSFGSGGFLVFTRASDDATMTCPTEAPK